VLVPALPLAVFDLGDGELELPVPGGRAEFRGGFLRLGRAGGLPGTGCLLDGFVDCLSAGDEEEGPADAAQRQQAADDAENYPQGLAGLLGLLGGVARG